MGCAPGVARSIHVNVLSNIIIMHDNTTTIYSLIICQVTFMFTFNIITMMLCFLFFFLIVSESGSSSEFRFLTRQACLWASVVYKFSNGRWNLGNIPGAYTLSLGQHF